MGNLEFCFFLLSRAGRGTGHARNDKDQRWIPSDAAGVGLKGAQLGKGRSGRNNNVPPGLRQSVTETAL